MYKILLNGKKENNVNLNQKLEAQSLFTNKIREKAQAILTFGDLLKPARNRILAHRDYQTHSNNIVMGKTTNKQLLDFMEAIQTYSDLVGNQIKVGPLDFTSSPAKGDVVDFVNFLRKSQTD